MATEQQSVHIVQAATDNGTAVAKQTSTPKLNGTGKEYGESGTFIQYGIITAEEYNSDLLGQKAIEKYDIMRRSDSTIQSVLKVCKLPVLSASWEIQPASDDAFDIEVADFIRRELFDRNINFQSITREALTMFEFGFSVFEMVFELTDYNGQQRIGINKLGFRKQRSIYAWETQDHKPGVTQQLLDRVVSIPREKLIIFTHEKEGDNYEGISLLRAAYKDWDVKDKLQLVNAIALEKMAIGVPVLTVPSGAPKADVERAENQLKEMRGNESGFVTKNEGWELEMLDLKSNSVKDCLPTIKYHDRQITLSVLAQFLSLGASDASGSRAVSEDHSKLFMLSEEAVANNISDAYQKQLIKLLCDLNFTELPNGYPKLVHSQIGDDNVTVLADAVQKFMAAGALTPDSEMEEHFRKMLRLPDMPDELKEDYITKRENALTQDELNIKQTEKNIEQIGKSSAKKEAAIRASRAARERLLQLLNED